MKTILFSLLASAVVVGGFNATAETVHYTANIPPTALPIAPSQEVLQAIALPQFDPSQGTLKSVQVTLSTTLFYDSAVLNFFQPQDVTLQFSVASGLQRPDATIVVQDNVTASESAFLQPFETRSFSGSASGSQTAVLSAAVDLALFTGNADVPLTLGALGQRAVLPFPESVWDTTTIQCAVQLDVTYEYEISVVAVALDVRPGSDSNPVNLKSSGVLPVAILSTPDHDALDTDVATLRLGDPRLNGVASPVRSAVEDVNGDGLLDLVLHFSMVDLVTNGALDASSTAVTLTGAALNGSQIAGADAVTVVPGSNKGKGR